jgi:hypothetical protein
VHRDLSTHLDTKAQRDTQRYFSFHYNARRLAFGELAPLMKIKHFCFGSLVGHLAHRLGLDGWMDSYTRIGLSCIIT